MTSAAAVFRIGSLNPEELERVRAAEGAFASHARSIARQAACLRPRPCGFPRLRVIARLAGAAVVEGPFGARSTASATVLDAAVLQEREPVDASIDS